MEKRTRELREEAESATFDHVLIGVRKDELIALLDQLDSLRESIKRAAQSKCYSCGKTLSATAPFCSLECCDKALSIENSISLSSKQCTTPPLAIAAASAAGDLAAQVLRLESERDALRIRVGELEGHFENCQDCYECALELGVSLSAERPCANCDSVVTPPETVCAWCKTAVST